MDPCPFVRLIVRNLALKIPVASKSARSVVHPSSSLCFCKPPLFRSFRRRTSSRTATSRQEALREVHIRRETIREDLHLRRPERHHLWGKLREAARKGVGAKTVISPLCGCVFSLELSIACESHCFFFFFGRFYQSGFKSKRRRRPGWT
jgi:hypothetical protein